VLQALDAEQVNEVVTQLLTRVGAMKRCGDEPSRLVGQAEREQHVQVALDGKTLRGTLSHEAADQRKMHQLALYETGTGLVLKEQVVGDKERAISRRCATICTCFGVEPPADCQDWRTARTVDKGHGRLEIREVVASTALSPGQAGAQDLLALVRQHWTIEIV